VLDSDDAIKRLLTAQDNCAIFASGGAFGNEYGIHDG
jgi:hypothetical protein